MIRLLIFDLDGVIYRGKRALPYALETLELLKKGLSPRKQRLVPAKAGEDYKLFFLTNNSTQSREQYVKKLAGLGIKCRKEEIMTSAYATALYFQELKVGQVNVFVVGGEGLVFELKAVGLNVLTTTHPLTIHYVVVGLDLDFNYQKLWQAQAAILSGAKFIATNRDATFPTEDGLMPGGGAIVSAVETATKTTPLVIGKPETYSLKKILDLAKVSAGETLMIGDRLETDILAGKRLNLKTALVLGGVCTKEEAERAPKELKPDYVLGNLSELPAILR